jgi:N-acetylneuraminate synthase
MVNSYSTPIIVAEIGNTHLANIDRAKKLIRLAASCEVDYVKSQKRNPEESTPLHMRDKPHPNQMFAYGNTYLEHRKNLELSIEQHKILYDYALNQHTKYSLSVWDLTSAKEVIENLSLDYIKIPSACNLNFKLIDYISQNFNGDIHISLGMIDIEIEDVINFLLSHNLKKRVVLYHCTSSYPCSFDEMYLLQIKKYKDLYSQLGFRIGFSNHGLGIAGETSAYTLGAEWFERHFIDDRTIKHTDAINSVEPDGMRRITRDLKAMSLALKYKDSITENEKKEAKKLRNY